MYRRLHAVPWLREAIPVGRMLDIARQDPVAPDAGGASAAYRFMAPVRAEPPAGAAPVIRFEGLPGVHAYRELVVAGGLMSVGPTYAEMHRRVAYFVDRILRGTRPGDVPVERPSAFELVINLRTAWAMGLAIPQSVLSRATGLVQ